MFNWIYRKDAVNKYSESETGVLRLFSLYLKTVYSTNVGKVIIIFSPMLVALALSVMFPPYFSVGAAQVFVTSLSSGVIWGMTYFSIRRSTFYKNMHGTRISKVKIYIAIWLTMLFVTFWSEVSYWSTTIILDQIGIVSIFELVTSVVITFEMNWLKVDWFTLGYTWMASVTLMFVACFITRWLFNTEMMFFIVLLLYILLLIPFGGILRPFISVNDTISNGIQLERDLNVVNIISLFVPQYHLDLFNFAALSSGVTTDVSTGATLGDIQVLDAFRWSDSWQWNWTIIYPIVFGIGMLIVAITTLDLVD